MATLSPTDHCEAVCCPLKSFTCQTDPSSSVGTGNPQNEGSWNPDGGHTGGAGGRLVTSCLALLTLEVYYRHLPLYKRDAGGLKDLEN